MAEGFGIRWPAALGLVALVASGCGLLDADAGDSNASEGTPSTPTQFAQPVDTVEIVVKDLVDVVEIDGTLGYGEASPLPNLLTGIATWLPQPGALVGFGEPLYEVSAQPVVLLEGDTPLYRTLELGIDDGADVFRFESWLAEQGFDAGMDLTVDEQFTSITAEAVEIWQTDAGLPATGSVELGTVVYRPEPVRISTVHVALGDRVQSGQVLSVTSTSRHVTVALDTGDAGLLSTGDTVIVELPDSSEVTGVVTFVSTIAQSEGQGLQQTSYLDVEIALEGGGSAFDESPVTVRVSEVLAHDATVVPIAALLALAEGGYAVEVTDDAGAIQLVPVQVGAIHLNEVEINGNVSAGQAVIVP